MPPRKWLGPVEHEDEELAHWLVEVGKRRCPPHAEYLPVRCAPAAVGASKTRCRTILLGLTAIAYLQYFYFDVLLDITALPALIFFVRAFG